MLDRTEFFAQVYDRQPNRVVFVGHAAIVPHPAAYDH